VRCLALPWLVVTACAARGTGSRAEPVGPDPAACAAAFRSHIGRRVAVAAPDPGRAFGVCLFEPDGDGDGERTIILGTIEPRGGGWRARWREDLRLDAPIGGEQLVSVQLDLLALAPGPRAVRVDLDVEVGFDVPWRRTVATRVFRLDGAGQLVEILAVVSHSTRSDAGEALEEHALRPLTTTTGGLLDLALDRVRTLAGVPQPSTTRLRWDGARYRRAP
jgi:hypothetical protein